MLGHPEWVDDEDFKTNANRVTHRKRLAELIEQVTCEHACGHWLERCEAVGIPCGPINSYAEVFSDPQVLAREMVVETEHPTLGSIRTLGTPLKLSETPLTPGRPAPALGADTDAILSEAGFSDVEIVALRSHRSCGRPAEVVRSWALETKTPLVVQRDVEALGFNLRADANTDSAVQDLDDDKGEDNRYRRSWPRRRRTEDTLVRRYRCPVRCRQTSPP